MWCVSFPCYAIKTKWFAFFDSGGRVGGESEDRSDSFLFAGGCPVFPRQTPPPHSSTRVAQTSLFPATPLPHTNTQNAGCRPPRGRRGCGRRRRCGRPARTRSRVRGRLAQGECVRGCGNYVHWRRDRARGRSGRRAVCRKTTPGSAKQNTHPPATAPTPHSPVICRRRTAAVAICRRCSTQPVDAGAPPPDRRVVVVAVGSTRPVPTLRRVRHPVWGCASPPRSWPALCGRWQGCTWTTPWRSARCLLRKLHA